MYGLFFKRVFDIFGALVGLGIFFVPLCLILVIVRIESEGFPIFFQRRVGRDGQEFVIYKIRTMSKSATMTALDQTTVFQNTKINDPRITRIGGLLRKFHIDELPQFINVLIGNMSLIGPRPDDIRQKSDYAEHEWRARNSVQPGITGLAQIKSSRSWLNHKNRLKYDLFYVYHKDKLRLDMMIIFATIKKIIGGTSF